MGKAAISLTTGLEDPEKVTVAFLVAVGAAESGRPTMMALAEIRQGCSSKFPTLGGCHCSGRRVPVAA
mgnify:CR=1 FL=1